VEHHPVVLELKGVCVMARIADKERAIRIVRVKSDGSGYEFRRKIRSAIFLLFELVQKRTCPRRHPRSGTASSASTPSLDLVED
jgi:hypothetical protein